MVYTITGPANLGATATTTAININGGVMAVTGGTSWTNTTPVIANNASTSITETSGSAVLTVAAAAGGSITLNTVSTNFSNATTNVITNFVTTTIGDLITTTGGSGTTLGRIAASTSGFVLTSNGAATLPTWQALVTPAGSARTYTTLSANQSIASGAIATPVALTTWTAAAGIYQVDSTFTVGTGVFLTATTGSYFFQLTVTWNNTDNNGHRRLTIDSSVGSIALAAHQPASDATTPINFTMVATGMASLTAADTVTFNVSQDSGSAQNVLGGVVSNAAGPKTTVLIYRLA